MAYNKRNWKARQGTGLNFFSIDGATPVPIVNQPTTLTEVGDALSAGNLNDLEDRIDTEFTSVESDVAKIKDGTTVVEKAKKDQNGNVIDTTYATKTELSTYATKTENNAKADKVTGGIENNLVALDANGNLKDSGVSKDADTNLKSAIENTTIWDIDPQSEVTFEGDGAGTWEIMERQIPTENKDGIFLCMDSSAPSSSSSAGLKGQFYMDANYLYLCIANNTWRRVALSTF